MKTPKEKTKKKLIDELRDRYKKGITKRDREFESATDGSANACFALLKTKAGLAADNGEIRLEISKLSISGGPKFQGSIINKVFALATEKGLKIIYNRDGCEEDEVNFTLSGWADEDPKLKDAPPSTDSSVSSPQKPQATKPKKGSGGCRSWSFWH